MEGVLHVEIARAESELMRPFHHAEIFRKAKVGSRVRYGDDVRPTGSSDDIWPIPPDPEPVSRDRYVDYLHVQGLRLDSIVCPRPDILFCFPNNGPRRGCPEGTDGT